MGLYLTVFEEDDEIDGVEVGSYGDFGRFREAVAVQLEGGIRGSKCPMLMLHSDCDGMWSPAEAIQLERELGMVSAIFRQLPPIPLETGSWQSRVAQRCGLVLASLYDCFFDVNGQPLIERLIGLAKLSQARGLPILFQ
jgi:hypothetical protein